MLHPRIQIGIHDFLAATTIVVLCGILGWKCWIPLAQRVDLPILAMMGLLMAAWIAWNARLTSLFWLMLVAACFFGGMKAERWFTDHEAHEASRINVGNI